INPTYIPLSGCVVSVKRDDGIIINFLENEPGKYRMEDDPDFLISGKQYSLYLRTNDGKEYESSYELMHPSMPIDSLYFNLDQKSGNNPEDIINGISFQADFTVDKNMGEYVRWQLTETYEFHNPLHVGYIYGLDRHRIPLPDTSSWRTCWITNDLTEYYTQSLRLLKNGEYFGKRLNFVSNETQRLNHGYSLLVKQYTISKNAFIYWNDLKENSEALGGLFNKQPSILYSNICNIDDEEELVIGYFSVSSASEKRIFAQDIQGLELDDFKYYCFPSMGMPPNLAYVPDNRLPMYFSWGYYELEGKWFFGTTKGYCLDCRKYDNSTHIKPSYW
ncbi:MAG: DUF4249 domain-containing protein, partial [Bacteroidales bacterium]|nr:DUF4249 domain-containing protein [Bacteroidales bacterium]